MPKVKSDVGAVADAIKEFFSFLHFWKKGSELRNLKAAARSAQQYIKRVNKIFPKAKDDKMLKKYKDNFEKRII